MAQRNNIRGAFSAHNTGHTRNRQGIALRQVGVKNLGDHISTSVHGSLSERRACGDVFHRHINHMGRPVGAHMSQVLGWLRRIGVKVLLGHGMSLKSVLGWGFSRV